MWFLTRLADQLKQIEALEHTARELEKKAAELEKKTEALREELRKWED
ncbi:unnamed protein product [marine sediment metagenome]|uniref:Uncharacterized protein n=1 Tax=marine sediment metagenome TaxID=412755 RepID=X0Y2N8_9ZZZZ